MLSFDPIYPLWLVGALMAVVAALCFKAYRRTAKPVSMPTRQLLLSLRVAAVCIVAVCSMRPVLVHTSVLVQKAPCVLMVDSSQSMRVKDGPGGQSRAAAVAAELKRNQKKVDELAEMYDLRTYQFASTAELVEKLDGGADGTRTDLPGALSKAVDDLRGAPAAGIVLVTDGRNNSDRDPVSAAQVLRSREIPLYTVGVGTEEAAPQFRDLSVKSIGCPERAFLNNKVPVEVALGYVGAAPAPNVKVILEEDGKPIDRKLLDFPAGNTTKPITFSYVPTVKGIHRLTIRALPLAGESVSTNNERFTFVRVFSSQLCVWYIEGRPRWEYKFLKRTLETAANIRLICRTALAQRAVRGQALLPANEEEWEACNLIIIGDVPRQAFAERELERTKRFVEEGGSLLMIGGFSAFGAGGYTHSAVEAVLPVGVTAADDHSDASCNMELTPEGLRHSITELADTPAENKRQWAALPRLKGYNRVARVKPGATVLAQAGAAPLLAVQELGQGRTAAFMADTTWKWIFCEESKPEQHKRFWRQFVIWLTKSDYDEEDKLVWAETDKPRYTLGEKPMLTAYISRKRGRKLDDLEIVAHLYHGSREIDRFRVGRGTYEPTVPLPVPKDASGEFSVKVEALQSGTDEVLDQDTARFLIDVVDLENENRLADTALLQRMATLTDGEYVEVGDMGLAFDALRKKELRTEIKEETTEDLWDGIPIFLIFLGLLGGEWWLRKRHGLA